VESALGAVAAEIGGDVHLVTGSGALPAPGAVPFADELVDALSYRLLSLREPAEIPLADGRVVVGVPVVVTAERPGPSRLVAVTADSVPRRDTVRSLLRGAEVIAGHQRGQRLVRLTRRPMAAEMLRRTLSGEATGDELAAWARGMGITPRGARRVRRHPDPVRPRQRSSRRRDRTSRRAAHRPLRRRARA
jgi:hypothetical protein